MFIISERECKIKRNHTVFTKNSELLMTNCKTWLCPLAATGLEWYNRFWFIMAVLVGF